MSPYDLILATALLMTPPGTPEQMPAADQWPGLQAAIHQTAVEWEILDPRETRYVLSRIEDFDADLNLLRRRYVELANAPHLCDAVLFPERQTINELVRFNRAYRKHLETRLTWEADRADVIHEAILETDRLYRIWDTVRDVRCEFYYVTVRRQALMKLRDMIGEEAYATGELPSYVPEWRFTEVR